MANRRAFIGIVAFGLLAVPYAVPAQPRPGAARVGFLSAEAQSAQVQVAFLQGMRDAGLAEGRDFVVDWRFADGRYERLPGLAADLVRERVAVIVAVTTLSVQAATHATTSVPIVMVAVPDPIGEGFAKSLSRPGGSVTGLSNILTEVSSKHLELLNIAVPRLTQVAVLINTANPSDALILEQIQGAAYGRRIKVFPIEAGTVGEIDAGFAAMTRSRVQALIVAADSFFDVQRARIVRLALENKLPTIFSSRETTEAGGLMSYGEHLALHYRRAATYVEKILKGAKPGALPIEQPTVLEFVLNRKTARLLGLAIPRELELRADRIVE